MCIRDSPKGVLIEHLGAINMALSQISQFDISEEDTCLQFANYSFDAFVWEILISIFSGAKLILLSKEILQDSAKFIKLITNTQISFATLPPYFLSNLQKANLQAIHVLVTAGERPILRDVPKYLEAKRYFNAYGPVSYTHLRAHETLR